MNEVDTLQSSSLIEPASTQRKKMVPISIIVVVVLGLILSILTQPFAEPDKLPSTDAAGQASGGMASVESEIQDGNQAKNNINITGGLAWIGQMLVSFIALLSAIGELTGIKVRGLFTPGKAKTNVEDFPFLTFNDYEALVDHLFPDPKISLLSDRKIQYLPQISDAADAAYQQRGWILIRGRSKTGKTREACELLQRWWYLGPTVLVVRSHVELRPPFKIPASLPNRNLVLFFDDIDRYLGDSTALKRLMETLQFFQAICHDRGELHVVATVRQEEEIWRKLSFDTAQSPWDQFDLVQVDPLPPDKAQAVIGQLAEASGIEIKPELVRTLSEKNDGTSLKPGPGIPRLVEPRSKGPHHRGCATFRRSFERHLA